MSNILNHTPRCNCLHCRIRVFRAYVNRIAPTPEAKQRLARMMHRMIMEACGEYER